VILDSPQHCVERVKIRVLKGGHSVPERKIVERYSRSLAQLPWFLEAADSASIYDNSSSEPRIIAEKRDGVLTVDPDALDVIKTAARNVRS
jgi:predicted ABC-type ATPase